MFARHIIAAFMALALLMTAQAMAQARGASAAAGQMVICTGTGPMVVHVDADGQPTDAPHLCPEAALHVLTDVVLPTPSFHLTLVGFSHGTSGQVGLVPPSPADLPPVRAPPLPV